jgi:putative FmdB family regulatory protein
LPIYEYECQSCGDVQEVMQKLSDPPPTDCPACHKGPLVKMISRTAFILKGEGWYVTDFRDKGKKPAAKTDGAKADGAKTDGAKAAETSTDKPAGGDSSSSTSSSGSGDSSGGSSDSGSSAKSCSHGAGCGHSSV